MKFQMSFKKKSSASSDVSSTDTQLSESRRRQSKRDDNIRRKIENDLSKKRRGTTRTIKYRKAAPGTVLSLKPSEPVVCRPTATVLEVSRIMTAKRENCILVVNKDGHLAGIFTAKDLAFRIVGSDLNAATVTIDKIMTPNPTCTNAMDPASDALTLMVQKSFRHLPVLDDKGSVVGVLDITKSYAQQMEKLERLHDSSKKLYEAFDTVHSEMGSGIQQPMQVFQYFEDLKGKMSGPTLDSVLDERTAPIYCSIKTTVYEATVLMRENKTTAVLVKDNADQVNGIFTSKDVVLRVIAAGLDPKKCSIVRVMTPQPDMADHNLSIQEALRKMFEGHYLNLPVIDDSKKIVGIVDVLKLTYATLNQIKQMSESEAETSGTATPGLSGSGPAWNKFWTSLDNETESVHSDSLVNSNSNVNDRPSTPSFIPDSSVQGDIKPSDSISHVGTPKKKKFDLDTPFVFKFKSPVDNKVQRVSVKSSDGLKKLRSLIDEKLSAKDLAVLGSETPYAISFVDDEGDVVSIASDDDLIDCISFNIKLLNDKTNIYLHSPHKPAPVASKKKESGSVSGISYEVLIPGALVVIATSAFIGFTLSKRS